MAFCEKCGNPIAPNAAFCGRCGAACQAAPMSATPVTPPAPGYQHAFAAGMHCPVCKSTNLSPMIGSSYAGVLAADNNSLVCVNCGKQFRTVQAVQESLHANQNGVSVSVWVTILAFFACLVLYLIADSGNMILEIVLWPFIAAGAIVGLVFFCHIFKYAGAVKEQKEELAYLQQNCF